MKTNIFPLLTAAAFLSVMFCGCKPSEKNYREAYEKAVADNDRGVTDFDNTIYNRYRAQTHTAEAALPDGTKVPVHIARVKVTPDGGGIPEWYRTYSVVVGEFKQLFNARSLQQRYVDAGYPRTFLLENAEPYYYIVVNSSDNLSQMSAVADSLRASSPVPLKEGFPYILQKPLR